MPTTEPASPPAPSAPVRPPGRFDGLGLHGLMTVLSLLMILPFAWMVLASLKTLAEAGEPAWLPKAAQWGNYLEVFQVIPFLRFGANSLVIAGWVTTEVGRQPYTVYGQLLTAQSHSPLAAPALAASLLAFVVVYFVVFGAGVLYLLRLMSRPPAPHEAEPPHVPDRAAGITPAPGVDPPLPSPVA